ncbi:MAG: hypothetical protein ABEJ26_11755 [Halosimplex sp.]
MKVTDVPVVGTVLEVGERNPVFDTVIALGPILVLVIALAGRNAVTTALAVLYLLIVPTYVALRAVRR